MTLLHCCISAHLTFQVSQGSAATDLRWVENFNKLLFRSSFLNIVVKKLQKSVNICQSYRKNKSGTFFYGPRCTTIHGILLIQFMCSTVFLHNLSLHFFFGLPLGLTPSTSYSIHFFTQSLTSFRSTCPYHRNLFCCNTEIMASNPSLPLNTNGTNCLNLFHPEFIKNAMKMICNCHITSVNQSQNYAEQQTTNVSIQYIQLEYVLRCVIQKGQMGPNICL